MQACLPHYHWHATMATSQLEGAGLRQFSCCQGMLTGQACSVQPFRSHLGRSACRQTLDSAGLGALIWRSLQRRSTLERGPTQARAC